jgi:hypothetical protein
VNAESPFEEVAMRALWLFAGIAILGTVLVPNARAAGRALWTPFLSSRNRSANSMSRAAQPGYQGGRPQGFHPAGIVQPGAQPGAFPNSVLFGWPGLFPGVPGANPGSMQLAIPAGAPGSQPVRPPSR